MLVAKVLICPQKISWQAFYLLLVAERQKTLFLDPHTWNDRYRGSRKIFQAPEKSSPSTQYVLILCKLFDYYYLQQYVSTFAPPCLRRPSRNITARSYSWTTFQQLDIWFCQNGYRSGCLKVGSSRICMRIGMWEKVVAKILVRLAILLFNITRYETIGDMISTKISSQFCIVRCHIRLKLLL